MKLVLIANFAKEVKIIKCSTPTKSKQQSGIEVRKKNIMREFFLPREESADFQATNIVGISAITPQYNF